MKNILAIALLMLGAHDAHALRKLETATPGTRLSAARLYREMPDAQGVQREVLVAELRIPGPARAEIDLDSPLFFQWFLNDRGQVVQSSFPYFATRILSLPASADLSPADRQRLLSSVFYFSITDLNPALIVSTTFNAELPAGGSKPILPLLWDAHNPKGTWGYAVNRALHGSTNLHLLDNPPADIVDFCPKFRSLGRPHRVHFWQALASEISTRESAHIPYCASDEGKYNPGAKGVISSGLLQLSIRSVGNACYQARGCSVIKAQQDLFDPAKNLHCGIAVMSCLANRGCISCKTPEGAWTGVAAYWSTLREPYTVPCAHCPSGTVRVGFKPEIRESLKRTASYCF